jgi:UDP-glucose 4-epimerase
MATALPLPVYTLSSDQGWTFKQFIEVLRQVCPELHVRCEAAAQGGFARFPLVRHATSDIRAAARDLGWKPQFSLRQSVEHFAEVLRD